MITKTIALINHVALVVDGSGSMRDLASEVVVIGDQLVKRLAAKSQETDQETRISLYVFGGTGIACHTYDKDVLRMPSLKGLYRTDGGTPLIDATLKAIDDLSKSATLYGDHAFLVYVLTDGQENESTARESDLSRAIKRLGENWTLACFVPNRRDASTAAMYGFRTENIQVWEASTTGMRDVGRVIDTTVNAYYAMRSSGVRGSKNLFSMDLGGLTKATVSRAGIKPLHFGQYRMLEVKADTPIAPFVEKQLGRPYRLGEAYYQLIKRETVQAQKQVAIHERNLGNLYTGAAARQLLSLPDHDVKVGPEHHPDFDIFIQSTSTNRKLLSGQKLVVLS